MPADEYLIETTILVDVFRGKPEAIAWVNNVPMQGRGVSIITTELRVPSPSPASLSSLSRDRCLRCETQSGDSHSV
jgi:hypothetical protein